MASTLCVAAGRVNLLFAVAEEVVEFGLVLGLAGDARLIGDDTRGLRLAHTFAGVGLDGLDG